MINTMKNELLLITTIIITIKDKFILRLRNQESFPKTKRKWKNV